MIEEVFKRMNLMLVLFLSLSFFLIFFSYEKYFYLYMQTNQFLDSIQETVLALESIKSNATVLLEGNIGGKIYGKNNITIDSGVIISKNKIIDYVINEGEFNRSLLIIKHGGVWVNG